MKYTKLLYKRKISYIGTLIFLAIFTTKTIYKIFKWITIKTIEITKWFIRYIRFIKKGYSYSDIYKLIMNMSGREFEIFMAELFKIIGYKVKLTQETKDGGKDLILYSDKGCTYVELKRWDTKNEIGRVLLQKLVGSAVADNVNNMIFITTSGYNKNAYEYAKKLNNLELWDIIDIMKMVVKIEQKQLPLILAKTFKTDYKIIRLNPVGN
jgi:hypothetical protein